LDPAFSRLGGGIIRAFFGSTISGEVIGGVVLGVGLDGGDGEGGWRAGHRKKPH
jgi:hypothetical protein